MLGAFAWVLVLLRFAPIPDWTNFRNAQLLHAVQTGSVSRAACDEHLLEAVRNADLDETNACLARGGNPNVTVYLFVSDGSVSTHPFADAAVLPLLMYAIPNNADEEKIGIVAALLKHGANANAQAGDEGYVWNPPDWPVRDEGRALTALQAAVRYGAGPKTVRLLLDYGANPNLGDSLGDTPLFAAVKNPTGAEPSSEVLSLLFEHGATLGRDHNGATPLMRAAINGSPNIMKMLMKRGAKINERDPENKTPLMFAAQHQNAKTLSFLLARGANPNAQDKNGQTALHHILYPIVNSGSSDGYNEYNRPLFSPETQRIVSLLQAHGAAFDAKDKAGKTPDALLQFAKRKKID